MSTQNAPSLLPQDEILHKVEGGVGWITLNRPQALNALSLNMIRTLHKLLQDWEVDSAVKCIVLEGAGDRAFCAGGDVRAIYDANKEGDLETGDAFFREEYTLNAYIHTYPKPYVSLVDGIAMGGGLGVSLNGSHRLVTERALLAMPETGIGFFPDVGATTFLKEAPGSVGLYLALTGTRIKAQDALWANLATHFIQESSLSTFKEDLRCGAPLEKCLNAHTTSLWEDGLLEMHYALIQAHFSQKSLEAVFKSLRQDPSPFAQDTLNTLLTKSPTSLAVIFRQFTQAPRSFAERMKVEFRLSQRFIRNHDFNEGIRAVLVDKDQSPLWNPKHLEEITPEAIDAYFAPLEGKELKV